LILATLIGCGQPADGLVETAWIHSRSNVEKLHPRVAGYDTPDSTRVQLWYERLGTPVQGSVVLLNGSDSQAIFWPLDFVVDLADHGYQVVRYDPRDVGLSEWLGFPDGFDPMNWTPAVPPPYGLDADVQDLWGLLDGLGIERAHLIGVSQGGMVAQLAAIERSERVLSLTLLSTTPSNPYDPVLGAVDPELLDYVVGQLPRVGRAAALSWFFGESRAILLQTDLLAEIS